MSPRNALSSLALTLTVAACAPPEDQAGMAASTVDSAAVTAAVADLWQRWIAADTSGNVAALVEMVGDSARIDVRGMPPLIGREAWRAAVEAAVKNTKPFSMSATPDLTLPISNELAYQHGSYVEGMTTGGKSMMDYGRYALAVRKYPDGQWRFAYVMAFSDSTVPVTR